MLLSLLGQNPLLFVLVVVVLLLSLALHEFGHAYAADRLGDSTPRRLGRLTLNPIAHLDPFGALLLVLAGFGYAKPVPVNFARVGRWGMLIVAIAGPAMNILVAIVCLLLLRPALEVPLLGVGLLYVFSINIVLAVFNLLPIPLLDGSRVLAALMPRTLGRSLMEFEQIPWSFMIVLLFIFVARDPIFQVVGFFRNLGLQLVGLA